VFLVMQHDELAPVATRTILLIGDPRLREVASPVPATALAEPATQRLIDELVATMRAAGGAGLAATQIGVPVRICVIEVDHNPRYPYKPPIPLTILVNPVLTPLTEELFENNEGCLSVPNVRGNVARRTEIAVSALDRFGGALEYEVRGLSAGTFQHECDHLDGRLFVDRVTDHTTLATWANFEAYQKPAYLRRVSDLVARYGS
jgi:peptide deformylase